jgi:hypothetical protein
MLLSTDKTDKLLPERLGRVIVTVDGTDREIQEPSLFHKMWFSHKSNGPGLPYEMAVEESGGCCIKLQDSLEKVPP